jgi:hypothetical protein
VSNPYKIKRSPVPAGQRSPKPNHPWAQHQPGQFASAIRTIEKTDRPIQPLRKSGRLR